MARIIDAFTQFFDDSGAPLVDGWLKFNETGTNNTDKATWADVNESIPNANPVPLDGAGRCPNVFGTGSFSVISFKDSIITPGTPGEQIQQFDPVGGNLEGTAFADWNAATIYSIGDKVTGSDGLSYESITNSNQNNNPTSSATNWKQLQIGQVWNTNVTYGLTDSVYGSDGYLYKSRIASNLGNDPTTSPKWEIAVNPALVASRGFIDGLITSNGTDAAHDIDTAVGECMDSTNSTLMRLASSITKQIDVDWAEGTAAGGFPSALTLSIDTWYHFFVIAKTDGTVDAGWDTSLSATNLLADATGYTLFRRVASHLTDASANIISFLQNGDRFRWFGQPIDIALGNPGTSAVLGALSTPLGIQTIALINARLADSSAAGITTLYISEIAQEDKAAGTGSAGMSLITGVEADEATAQFDVFTDTSSQIRTRISVSTADHSVQIKTVGWLDFRGKQ
jgi:hypothetical protein